MDRPIYMDHHATTPLDERVLAVMLPYLREKFGNPASRTHLYGLEALEACDRAREQIAALIGAAAAGLVFTSGATESNNLALLGAARMAPPEARHLITAVTEHRAVLDPCRQLEKEGFQVTYLGVNRYGEIDLEELSAAIRPETFLISLMAANNEIGTRHPLAQIGELASTRGVLFHTDASQAAGKVALDVRDMRIDLLSLSGHKMYGPKGIGALWVRDRAPRVRLAPLIHGGGHQRGLRSGTLDVPGIVGLGAACDLARREMARDATHLTSLVARLHERIAGRLEGVYLNGHPERRVPGNLNLSFDSVDGSALIAALGSVAVASRSACSTETDEPSHVLRAIGVPDRLAQASLRFGLGRSNTEDQVDRVASDLVTAVKRLRAG